MRLYLISSSFWIFFWLATPCLAQSSDHDSAQSNDQGNRSCFESPSLSAPYSFTLAQLVDRALKNHPSTLREWWSVQRAESQVALAKSSYLPQLGLVGNAVHGRAFQFINGPDIDYATIGADLTLSWLLCDFGGRAAGVDSAKKALQAVTWQKNGAIQRVMLRVLESGYQTLHAQNSLEAISSSLEDAERLLALAKELQRVGLSPLGDVYTAQAAVCQMKIERAEREAALRIQRGRLATSVGLSAEQVLHLESVDFSLEIELMQSDQLLAIAKQRRSDLLSQRANVAVAEHEFEKTRSAGWPKLSLLSSAGSSRELDSNNGRGANYRVGLTLEIPLFDGFQTSYRNHSALATTHIASQELEELELQISLDILTQCQKLQAAKEMLPYAAQHLTSCEMAYESTLERYKASQATIYELSSSLRQLSNARVQCSDIKTQWLVCMASVAYATGTLDPATESP